MKKMLHRIFWGKYYISPMVMDGSKIQKENDKIGKRMGGFPLKPYSQMTVTQKMWYIHYIILYYCWSYWGNKLL